MSKTSLIPADVSQAAKRGFIRTTSQAYSTALASGISAAAILSVVTGETQLIPLLITAAVTVISPLLAGAASALSILSKGIPGDYLSENEADDAPDGHALASADEIDAEVAAENEPVGLGYIELDDSEVLEQPDMYAPGSDVELPIPGLNE